MPEQHLAEVNIGRLVAPIDAPAVAEFHAALEPVNALAEAAPGYVWRLQTEEGDATAIQAYDDPLVIVNLSTWTSVQALRAFMYGTVHKDYLARRREWFQRLDGVAVALWWVPAGDEPTVEDAKARLAHLEEHGPTPHAFTLRQAFPAPG